MDNTPTIPPQPRHLSVWGLLLAVAVILILLGLLMGLTDNVPGILCLLTGVVLFALGLSFRFAKSGRRKPAMHLLYWTPRMLCMIFALFISLFALDVFDEGSGFWNTLLALMMHLVPTFLLIVVLVASWRREWIGGIFFPLLGVAYIIWAWNRPFGHWGTFLMMAGPLVLTGVLFLLNWMYRGKLREGG